MFKAEQQRKPIIEIGRSQLTAYELFYLSSVLLLVSALISGLR